MNRNQKDATRAAVQALVNTYNIQHDKTDEPISCHRCGARFAEDPSCGKSIHASLPSRS